MGVNIAGIKLFYSSNVISPYLMIDFLNAALN